MKTFTATILAAALTAGAASAATLTPIGATFDPDAVANRGSDNGRNIIGNAFDGDASTFFEIGLGSTVDFVFGQPFTGPGSVIEVTFGSADARPESATIFGGRNGTFTELARVTNAQSQTPFSFAFGGTFDVLRFTDTSTPRQGQTTGGFDIAEVSVSPVPVPAAGLLLLGGLAGMGAMARRKR
ncbi:VPLPA-CTERM sorting domain-containing protein [Jannaschia sp. LMIT008]|uniref:VPLPA-CTERM sorting domain-containing protein n=1 Tax=Jannaschia maritima TaxID=3032585 RepID=UPI0028128971|nr:VPLPA-CTERM sorting domain-containing protein [Jannaschia sp. LMIT008]